ALSLIEEVRSAAGADQNRASYMASRQDAFRSATPLLMELGETGAAYETTERSRARSMLDMLAGSGTDIREGVNPALASREKEIANLLNAKGARLLARPADEALQREARDLENQYQDVRAEIRRTSPRYAALTQ